MRTLSNVPEREAGWTIWKPIEKKWRDPDPSTVMSGRSVLAVSCD